MFSFNLLSVKVHNSNTYSLLVYSWNSNRGISLLFHRPDWKQDWRLSRPLSSSFNDYIIKIDNRTIRISSFLLHFYDYTVEMCCMGHRTWDKKCSSLLKLAEAQTSDLKLKYLINRSMEWTSAWPNYEVATLQLSLRLDGGFQREE